MDKVIVVREPTEETIDFLVSNFPLIDNGDSVLIPFDCLDDLKESSIKFEVIEY